MSDHIDHTNTNGLVHGDIPADTACPFWTECPYLVERCPTPKNLKPHPYSCAAARLQSIILNSKERQSPIR